MNTHEELTKMLMESYDKGVEDAMQAALEGIQKAMLLEREACAKVAENCFEGVGKHKPIIMAVEAAKAIRARGNT